MRLRLVKAPPMTRTFIPIVVFLLCTGCQKDKRFSRLQVGMTKSEVLAIVGKHPDGDTTRDGVEALHWEDGSHFAKLKNGKLTDYGSD